MESLSQKRVFITGAANGIGLAAAQRFHAEGAQLVLIDLPELGKTSLSTLIPSGMEYIQADVSSDDGLALIESAMQSGIDILINNAGITRDSSIGKMSKENWDSVIAVNLTAVFTLSQAAIPIMKKQGGGVILNASSVVAHYGNYGQANYVAAKAGVIGLTKTLAREVGKYGIRVNAIAPGLIETEMVKKLPENVIEAATQQTFLKSVGKPEDVAALYAFLGSDQAKYITGATINIDGGLIM